MARPRLFRDVAVLATVVALLAVACGTGTPASAPPSSGGSTASAAAPSAASTAAGSPAGSAAAAGPCMPAKFPAANVSITAWTGTDSTAQALGKELVASYQTVHPNVKVDNVPTGTTDGFPKMLVAFPAGVGTPTVAIFYEPLMETFIGPGYLEPAIPEALCATSQKEIIDRYIPGSIDPLLRNGIVNVLPVQRNAYSLLINNDKFTAAGLKIPDDIPKTWEDVATLQPKLKKVDASGKVTQKGFEFRYSSGDQWYSSQFIGMVYQEGGEILDASGKAVLTSPAAVNALKSWASNVVDSKVTNNTGPSPYQDFADGQDVMAFGGPNALRFALTLNPALEGHVTVAPLPRKSGAPVSGMAYGFHYGVNKNASADEKFVAWNFIDYFIGDANLWWKRTGQLQPKKDWYNTAESQQFVGLNVFIDDLAKAKALPNTTKYGALQTAIKNAIQRTVFDKVDPAASLQQAQQEYDAATK
jgi:multiple sugar transport system substrate-binding protein